MNRKLAVSDIHRNFRGGIPVSAHRLIAGLVREAAVAILSAEFHRGTVIDDGSN